MLQVDYENVLKRQTAVAEAWQPVKLSFCGIDLPRMESF